MFYGFEFERLDGRGKISLRDYTGKLVLIVNTASACGFTPQYKGLEELWQRYKDRGLIVIGVPTNDFAHQEPLSNSEIEQFCQINYGVTFIMTKKSNAKGKDIHPFFLWARQQFGFLSGPKWNFYKYLV